MRVLVAGASGALAVADGLDWARDICQRGQQTVTWRM